MEPFFLSPQLLLFHATEMASHSEEVWRKGNGSLFPSTLHTLLNVGGGEIGMIFKMTRGWHPLVYVSLMCKHPSQRWPLSWPQFPMYLAKNLFWRPRTTLRWVSESNCKGRYQENHFSFRSKLFLNSTLPVIKVSILIPIKLTCIILN